MSKITQLTEQVKAAKLRLDSFSISRHFITTMPDETLSALQPFLFQLYRILEEATTLAMQDFENRGRPVEDYHLASGVRNEARWRLQELAGTEFECSMQDLSNNGLQILYGRYALRIRKSENGECPAPTQSKAYALYYYQLPLDLVWPDGRRYKDVDQNLMVLWEFDRATRSLGRLFVSKPGEWSAEIPHPAGEILPPDDEPTDPEYFEDLEIETLQGEDEEEADQGKHE